MKSLVVSYYNSKMVQNLMRKIKNHYILLHYMSYMSHYILLHCYQFQFCSKSSKESGGPHPLTPPLIIFMQRDSLEKKIHT